MTEDEIVDQAEALPERFADRLTESALWSVKQMRGGKTYDSQWGQRMKGEGPLAALNAKRFRAAKVRYGLMGPIPPMDLGLFRVPPKAGSQIDLFG